MPSSDPNVQQTSIGSYSHRFLAGPQYVASGETLNASIDAPLQSGGPGGIRYQPSLAQVSQMLHIISQMVDKLPAAEQQTLQNELGSTVVDLPIPGLLAACIQDAANYLEDLEKRDAFLVTALQTLMSATK